MQSHSPTLPGQMRQIGTLFRRELGAIVRTPGGWIIAAAVLLVDGLLFNAFAVGTGAKLSGKVVEDFFYFAAGTTMIASILLAMRLLAEDRASGAMALLLSSPIDEVAIVLGKYLAAWTYLVGLTAISLTLPALLMINGKVSGGHVLAGALGLLLLGGATLALGTLASSLARSQLVAGVLGAALVVVLLLAWLLAKVSDPPIKGVLQHLALFDAHFRPLQRGLLRLSDLVFFASVIAFSLGAATRVLGHQRWS